MAQSLLHVLGAGDLGVAPGEFGRSLDAAIAAAEASDSDAVLASLRATRPEDEHDAGPPLLRVLAELRHDTALLVATDQQRDGDTIRLARLFEGLVDSDWIALVGYVPNIQIVVCNDFGVSAFTEPVSAAVAVLDREGDLDLTLSGSVQMVVWAFLGALAASRQPTLIDPHGSPIERIHLDVADGLEPLLARQRQFGAIAGSGQRAAARGATDSELRSAEDAVKLTDAVPDDPIEQVRRLARSMYARLDRGDHSGISLIRPVLAAAYAARHGILDRRGHLQTDALEQLLQRDPARLSRSDRLERAAIEPVVAWADASASVVSEFTAEELRARAHWISGVLSLNHIHKPVPFPQQAAPVFASLGLPPWPHVRSSEPSFIDLPEQIPATPDVMFPDEAAAWSSVPYSLVLMGVGSRDYAPMFQAIIDALSYPQIALFPTAQNVALLDPAHAGLVAAQLQPGDVVTNLELVTAGLDATRGQPNRADRVIVALGPGTLAMNFAMVVGGLDYALRHGLPFHLAGLRPTPDGDTTLEIDHQRTIARLIDDGRLEPVARHLVKVLRFDLALELCRSYGTAEYQLAVEHEIVELRELVFGDPHDVDHLAARLAVLESAAANDPWWATLVAGELVERAYAASNRDLQPYWQSALYRYRAGGPFGSSPHADPANVDGNTAAVVIARFREDEQLGRDISTLERLRAFAAS